MKSINPTSTAAWTTLSNLSKTQGKVPITQLFDQAGRFEKYSIQWEDILVDFSKNRITEEIFSSLLALAEQTELSKAIESMFTGQAINQTENRAVLHTALRNRSNQAILVEGKDVGSDEEFFG